ncbi:MAG: 50S ribosomal protein L4 [Rhodothermales bacterium]
MELQVYQVDGSETGRTVALDASVFGIEPNDHVLWLDVRRIQANGRQGTHKTKERGEVAGSTRKLYRQKGTGMARAGSAKSPIRRSGGRTFGPRSRTYGLKLSKKTRRLARCSALSYKARAEALRVVENAAFETPSTSQLREMIKAFGLTGQKVLVLTEANDQTLYRSSTNLAKVHVQEVRNASTLELLDADVVVLEEGAVNVLLQTLSGAEPVEVEQVETPPVEEAPVAKAKAAKAEVIEEAEVVVEAEAVVEAAEAQDADDEG